MEPHCAAAVSTKLTRPLHIPRLPRTGVLGVGAHRFKVGAAGARGWPCSLAFAPSGAPGPEPTRRWQRLALREGVVVTLLTSLLTSAVLASPELFRQSPAVSWRQLTTPALALGPLPGKSVLVECP